MAAPAGPVFQFHPAAAFTPTGVRTIPLTLSGADVDLTLSSGPTGGYMARALLIGSASGNVVFYDMTGAGPFTQAVGANQEFSQTVSQVASTANGTTVAVSAML